MDDGKIITTVSVPIYRDDMKQGALCGAVRLDTIANMFAEYELVMDMPAEKREASICFQRL